MRKHFKQLAVAVMVGCTTLSPCILPIANITAYAKTTLDTPSNPHWGDKKDEDEGYFAHWDEVENAKKYEVYLYYINDNDGYTKVGNITTTKTLASLRNKMTKDADYVFRVRAVGAGDYSTSSWSDYSEDAYFEKESSTESSQSGTSGIAVVSNNGTTGPGVSTTAAGWQKNDTGWWYATNAAMTTWHSNGWQWLDGNHDGIAECYYFDQNGYALTNTTTPDGYQVNGDGAWIVNGVVQTRQQ